MSIKSFEVTDRFKRDFKKLDKPTQAEVSRILNEDLMPWPSRKARRHHTLSGYDPTVHVIDVYPNRSYQITFSVQGSVARLLRVGTHKQIDLNPEG